MNWISLPAEPVAGQRRAFLTRRPDSWPLARRPLDSEICGGEAFAATFRLQADPLAAWEPLALDPRDMGRTHVPCGTHLKAVSTCSAAYTCPRRVSHAASRHRPD